MNLLVFFDAHAVLFSIYFVTFERFRYTLKGLHYKRSNPHVCVSQLQNISCFDISVES